MKSNLLARHCAELTSYLLHNLSMPMSRELTSYLHNLSMHELSMQVVEISAPDPSSAALRQRYPPLAPQNGYCDIKVREDAQLPAQACTELLVILRVNRSRIKVMG